MVVPQEDKNISDEIPYEKKIHLMKTTDLVKTKARDKLKEINSGKPGESNNKATQYLEGLLKIPFGIYKKTIIKRKLDDLLLNVSKYKNMIEDELNLLEENNILNDNDLVYTEDFFNILKEFSLINKSFIINKFINNLDKWLYNVNNSVSLDKYYKGPELSAFLSKKYKITEVNDILKELGVTHKLKIKGDIIKLLIKSNIKSSKIKYIFIQTLSGCVV